VANKSDSSVLARLFSSVGVVEQACKANAKLIAATQARLEVQRFVLACGAVRLESVMAFPVLIVDQVSQIALLNL
jgi:hypothetical protein